MAISNLDDLIDSRAVIARIEELEDERQALADASEDEDGLEEDRAEAKANLAAWDDSDEAYELLSLKALVSEAEPYCPDWKYGTTLIRDSYFEDYAQELASELYSKAIGDAKWPFDCIDWEKAAEELQQDYTEVEFDGVTYWVR